MPDILLMGMSDMLRLPRTYRQLMRIEGVIDSKSIHRQVRVRLSYYKKTTTPLTIELLSVDTFLSPYFSAFWFFILAQRPG
jgi:hypothetical protein